ncbi:hypothetical protein FJTKL_01268 [Diaporthe vaccinii]|uniref:Uncharacterized protein n=1 Tax=Diaporthe vaccinii TaxID=105482 RepID=A0ABR4E1E1_9PEZI
MSWLFQRNTAPRPTSVLNPQARTSRSASPDSRFVTASKKQWKTYQGGQQTVLTLRKPRAWRSLAVA